jgi:protein arginine kinase activator
MYDKVCNKCGRLLSEFYNTGMLGCPNCYQAFEREINLALKKIQGRTSHVGKNPNTFGLDKELLYEYQRLIKEKESAVIEGRFDELAELSAEILELSEELKKRGLI